MTLVELIVSFTILALLTTMALPLARYKVRRDRERELRYAVREMRTAIDKYKDMADLNQLGPQGVDTDNYPPTLDVLVEGVTKSGTVDTKIRFLRRVPKDPMTGTFEWGMRSTPRRYASPAVGAGKTFSTYLRRARRRQGMARRIRNGDLRGRTRGFTLVELMIVMTIVTVIMAMAVPMYQKAIVRAKESVLKNNLFTLRTLIDEYTFDKAKAPQTLDDLVREGYLRQVPVDPMTGSNQTWRIIMEDAMASVNQMEPGIFDVRSGSDQGSLEGTPYADW